jgi:hypothetical protein
MTQRNLSEFVVAGLVPAASLMRTLSRQQTAAY